MATLFSDQRTNDEASPPVRGEFAFNGAAVRRLYATYTMTGNEVAADVIEMVSIPKGARVWREYSNLKHTACASTVTLDVGDGSTADRYIDGLDASGASGTTLDTFEADVGVAVNYTPFEYTAADTIDVTLKTLTTPNATGVIQLTVTYTMNG